MELIKDNLIVKILHNRKLLGQTAAAAVSKKINELLQTRPFINMIFAAAPSQNEFLETLVKAEINWAQVNAFHMDEYLNLDPAAPQGFGNFLRERLFDKVTFKSVNYLNGNAPDVQQECARYAGLLADHPADIVCMGIGENTHLAFNDPHVADFDDPLMVKIVDLDQACRLQQVNDGCFDAINQVPAHALTLTIPALYRAACIFAMVPGKNKAAAVRHTLNEPVTENYPSTILRKHANAVLFIDEESGADIYPDKV